MLGKENTNPNQAVRSAKGKEGKAGEYMRERTPSCLLHGLEIGRQFCFDCLSYSICSSCEQHEAHATKRFGSSSQAKEQTKEVLLAEVEQTLGRLKGRENELKSQAEEVSLIKNRLKQLHDEVVSSVRQQLQLLEAKLQEKLSSEFDRYEREIEAFYREYNAVNDHLRTGLLQIVDGEIDLQSFSGKEVRRELEGGLMPQFGRVKLAMEQCRKYLKGVRQAAGQLEGAVRFFSSEEEKSQIKFEKYDRFLKEKAHSEECSLPLMRTLSSLEDHRPDLRLKMRS